jgi:hypothetical protein
MICSVLPLGRASRPKLVVKTIRPSTILRMEATRFIKSVLGAKAKREAAHDVGVSDIVVAMAWYRFSYS